MPVPLREGNVIKESLQNLACCNDPQDVAGAPACQSHNMPRSMNRTRRHQLHDMLRPTGNNALTQRIPSILRTPRLQSRSHIRSWRNRSPPFVPSSPSIFQNLFHARGHEGTTWAGNDAVPARMRGRGEPLLGSNYRGRRLLPRSVIHPKMGVALRGSLHLRLCCRTGEHKHERPHYVDGPSGTCRRRISCKGAVHALPRPIFSFPNAMGRGNMIGIGSRHGSGMRRGQRDGLYNRMYSRMGVNRGMGPNRNGRMGTAMNRGAELGLRPWGTMTGSRYPPRSKESPWVCCSFDFRGGEISMCLSGSCLLPGPLPNYGTG